MPAGSRVDRLYDVLSLLVIPHLAFRRHPRWQRTLDLPSSWTRAYVLNGANSEYKFKEEGDVLIGTEMDEKGGLNNLPSDSKVKLFPTDA